MKKTIISCLLAAMSTMASAQVPAFPGAEGFGRFTTGGRGKAVVHVTNLNDSGTGSLRWALSQGSGGRTIVFDVGGTIELNSDLNIPANTTIAGQTAPQPGITLRYYTVQPSGSNIIMRYIRIRRGEEKNVNDGADAFFARHFNNIILDHCSFSWCIDECVSMYDNVNTTVQWCSICESLNYSGHSKGAHGYGGIWGGKGASFHHNLLAHHNNRAPRLNGARYNWGGYDKTKYANSVQAEQVDVRNNVIYNWGQGNGAYGGMGGYHNLVANYYKAGPATKNKTRVFQCSANSSSDSNGALPDGLMGRFYINGNYVTAANQPNNYDWSGVIFDGGYNQNGARWYSDTNHLYGDADAVCMKLDNAVDAGEVTTHTANMAYNKVLAYMGASLFRDAEDIRYVRETTNGTTTYTGTCSGYTNDKGQWVAVTKHYPGLIDYVSDAGGYHDPGTSSRPADFDTDNDGIADDWETANGLNPADAADAMATTLDGNGFYTNLEVYLNSLVEDITKAQNQDANQVVDEYYPRWTDLEGVVHNPDSPQPEVVEPQEQVEELFVLNATTCTATAGQAVPWTFTNGFQMTSTNSSRNYATGNNNTIKYSKNYQYIIVVPEGHHVDAVKFKGYSNDSSIDVYLSEVNGTSFSNTTYQFPRGKGSSWAEHTVELGAPVSNEVSFTINNAQACLDITVVERTSVAPQGEATSIRDAAMRPSPRQESIYNLQGQRVKNAGKGICVVKGKKVVEK